MKCKCKTRSETWECSKAQAVRKTLGIKDIGNLVLLECNDVCRAKKEAEEFAKKEREEREREQKRLQEEEGRAASQANKKKKKKDIQASAIKEQELQHQKKMQNYVRISIGVALIAFFIGLVVYMANSY